ncbi:hypothetical protein FS837_009969 [Tulasnella sp. UAMH 9824]|nr:hypothetical protein FS837_009969 [Tulasnella sp. UAMH 9824]
MYIIKLRDEAIFALEGWPRPQFAICKKYYQAINYLNLKPADYPRWLRIIIWPETAGDMSEPTVPEASEAEFRHAFLRMREMGYPEDQFPPWFIEKIPNEDQQLARQITHEPREALTVWGSAADYATSSAQASAAQSQLALQWGHPICEEIKSPRLRRYPASLSQESSPNTPTALGNLLATNILQPEDGRARVTTWLADSDIHSSRSSGNGEGMKFNPATQKVDLWGIDDRDLQMDSVDTCLGPIATRYFHHHYYSHGSKAVVVWAYWYHHEDSDQFVKHLFRRGVLPMLSVYIWELLHTLFNWKAALKAGIEMECSKGSGSSRTAGGDNLDFPSCPECEGCDRLVVKVEQT